ncbi:hypothetical protein ACFZDJ_14085 [Streptomyces sp. NPDC007896]
MPRLPSAADEPPGGTGINHAHSWQGHDFDFTEAEFYGGDFS